MINNNSNNNSKYYNHRNKNSSSSNNHNGNCNSYHNGNGNDNGNNNNIETLISSNRNSSYDNDINHYNIALPVAPTIRRQPRPQRHDVELIIECCACRKHHDPAVGNENLND